MARINLEDSLDDDPRFHQLQKLVGRQLAYGVWRDVAKVAQNYWKKDCSLIPKHIFNFIENHDAMIKSGLCIELEHGFKLVGSEEAFSWLIKRVSAGKIGGSNKNSKLRPSKRKQNEANASKRKPPTLTPTLSHTHNKNTSENTPELRKETWTAYAASIERRYGHKPIQNKTVNSKIKQLVERLGKHAPSVVEFYVSINDPFYEKNSHDIGVCLSKAEALFVQWKSGKSHNTRGSPKTFEQQRTDQNQETWNYFDRLERGEE